MTAGRVIVLGAGGHAAVIIEIIRAAGLLDIAGAIDPNPLHPDVLGVPVLGDDDHLPEIRRIGIDKAVVALGDGRLRQRLAEKLVALGFALPPVVHPGAIVSPSAVIEAGVVVMPGAVINARARIHELAIVNTRAVIEHDDVIGPAAHVAPGVSLAGNVQVGERTMIGVGSVVRDRIRIGVDVMVGAGSVVVADIHDGMVVAGNPARPLRGSRGTGA